MVLAAVFAHCHAEAFLENGFCVIDVAKAALFRKSNRRYFGFLQHCRQDCETSFRNEFSDCFGFHLSESKIK